MHYLIKSLSWTFHITAYHAIKLLTPTVISSYNTHVVPRCTIPIFLFIFLFLTSAILPPSPPQSACDCVCLGAVSSPRPYLGRAGRPLSRIDGVWRQAWEGQLGSDGQVRGRAPSPSPLFEVRLPPYSLLPTFFLSLIATVSFSFSSFPILPLSIPLLTFALFTASLLSWLLFLFSLALI